MAERSIVILGFVFLCLASVYAQLPATSSSRLAWTQEASSLAVAQAYEYSLQIDGSNRVTLSGVTCSAPTSIAGFNCEAPVPAMTPGDHDLRLLTVDVTSAPGQRITSAPTATIRVTMTISPATATNFRVIP